MKLEISARSSDEGRLYGSIGVHEIIESLNEAGHTVTRQEVNLPQGPLKEVGEFAVQLQLHAEVVCDVSVVITGIKA